MKKIFTYILLSLLIFIACTACNGSGGSNNSVSEYKKSGSIPKQNRKLLSHGIKRLQAGDAGDAIIDFKRVISSNPDLAIAHYNLGLAYAKSNQLNEAIKSWENTVLLDNKYADAYYNLGLAYKTINNSQKAEQNLINYIMLRPNDPDINNIKGGIEKLKQPSSGKGIIGHIAIADEADLKNNIALNPKSFLSLILLLSILRLKL